MLDASLKQAYAAACSEHETSVAPALRRIDAALEEAAHGRVISDRLARLQSMRVLLLSGLFDPEFYLDKYPDVREAGADPLEHFAHHGDAENRQPNHLFYTRYYRQHHMNGLPADGNALQHYIEVGERSGGRPNAAFDPRGYVAANRGFADYVDRPLFHFLKVGREGGQGISAGVPDAALRALDYLDYVIAHGSEHHDLLLEAKGEIIDELGIDDGYILYRRIVQRSDHSEIRLLPKERLEESAPKRARAFYETGRGGEPFTVAPPKVIGEGNHLPLHGRLQPTFVACLIEARVRTGSNMIEVDQTALFPDEEVARDPAVFAEIDRAAWVLTPNDEAVEPEIDEGFSLLGIYAGAFGHWMVQFLPRYVAAQLSGALPAVPVLIEADMPKSHRQALELMLPEGSSVIELPPFSTARVRRLWCAADLHYIPAFQSYDESAAWHLAAFPPQRYGPVIREMARRIGRAVARGSGPDRVYFARRPPRRTLVNRVAIEELARRRGFIVVYPEGLDFIGQANLVRSARYIMGPDGSAMFLAFFAPARTKVCILTSVLGVIMPQADRAGPFAEIGIDLTIFTGRCTSVRDLLDTDYEIDEEALGRFLDVWLAAAG